MRYTIKWKFWNFIEVRSRIINDWALEHCNKEGNLMLERRRDRENAKEKEKWED